MPQSVSDPAVSNHNDMPSTQAEETPPEAHIGCKAERPEDVARASQLIRRTSPSRNNRANLTEELKHIIKLLIPVSLCMLVVIATTSSITFYTKPDTYLAYIPFTDQTVDTFTKVWQSFANAFIVMGVLVCVLIPFTLLYKFGFYKVTHGWLILNSLLSLFLFGYIYLSEILQNYNIPMDYITLSIMMWNFGGVGMVCIHWNGPLILQQAYLILIAALWALVFIKFLPDWTSWLVLGAISVWDVISVLCPKGPIRILIKTAQERNEPIFPELIYSTHHSDQDSLPDGLPFQHQNMSISSEYEGYQQAIAQHAAGVNDANRLSRHPAIEQMASLPTVLNLSINNEGNYNSALGSSLDNNSGSSLNNREIPKMSVYKPARVFKEPEGGVAGMTKLELDEAEDNVFHDLGSSDRSSEWRCRVTGSFPAPNPSFQRQESYSEEEDSESYSEEEERGVELGRGDFICYSLLEGKASSYGEWSTTVACFVAILLGLCLTMLLLAILKKPLPALLIPITFGSICYFTTSSLVQPQGL